MSEIKILKKLEVRQDSCAPVNVYKDEANTFWITQGPDKIRVPSVELFDAIAEAITEVTFDE